MNEHYTSVEEQVEYGLATVDSARRIEVSLRDLLYVQKTLGEFIPFFHNRAHYPRLEDVHRFIGNSEEGALHLLWECYYRKLRDVWPDDVEENIDEGRFDHPLSPYFFKPGDET